ncbi:hypothetical protein Z043_125228 [Scleropages formosus]|uniref:OCIA domain-containing protein n=1 Tax=Scleropages formosus TaxID=113540 RepID=A0A0P7XW71_SCLFO|nr:hypothetical protein Z043_125228 [Scleropages formosus]
MAVTGGLIYNGKNVAGVLGYVVGKASYMSTCREKFHKLGLEPFGPGFGPGFGPRFWNAPEHRRHCHHVCEECKKEASVRKETSHS